MQILLKINPKAFYCWAEIKNPEKIVAFFILATINQKTCDKILNKEIRGAKQLNEESFVSKIENARGIYIVNIVSTSKNITDRGFLMIHLKEEIELLLEKNKNIKYLFTRPINSKVSSLAIKYHFEPVSKYPSPIYVAKKTSFDLLREDDELSYPYN